MIEEESCKCQKIVFSNRDPTEKDDCGWETIWVSSEYHPNRVFRGSAGMWMFIGKFYANNN